MEVQTQAPEPGGHGPERIPPDSSPAVAVGTGTLEALRQGHWQAYLSLRDRLQAARDLLEIQHLQQEMLELKLRQQREELEWLRADALSRGELEDATRLEQGLAALEPRGNDHTPSTGGSAVNKLLLLLCLVCALGGLLQAAEPVPAAEPAALAELRSRHGLALRTLESAIRAAAPAERAELERSVGTLKQTQRREWLTLRLEQEIARGDLDKVARLRLELEHVTPPPAPPATTFVTRDTDIPPLEQPKPGVEQ
ncbi:MAG: hypothetical protein WC326_04615 [Candidatus Delongbacteria bacterium]